MKVLNAFYTFLVESLLVRSGMEIQITTKDLITSFTTENHFDSHSLYFPTEEVHRGTCSNGGYIVGFKVVDDIGNSVQALLHCEDILVVYGAEIVGDLTGSEEIW